MFEALMPDLFVPEERWAPKSWGENHPLTVRAQIHHGLREAGYGYWGFSPSNIPEGGYGVFGVDGIGTDPGGAPSGHNDGAHRPRLATAARAAPRSPIRRSRRTPTASSRRTPRSSALRYAPREALDNLRRLAARLPRPVRQVGLPRQRQRATPKRGLAAPTCRWTRG